ncbi:MAG TPA: hypothetical protein VJZ71_06665 [Phycisphaerae bacterium]|nr:hypothetical protein [Phycisphaerae bacterium]
MTSSPVSRRGTTVVELLFLLSTLSLLVAVGVPEVLSADRARQRHQCTYRLKVLAQAATYYSQTNDSWILGSPNTSGAYLTPDTLYAYGHAVQVWDFMGPLAEFFGLGFTLPPDQPANNAALIERFNQIRNSLVFQCPANGFVANHFYGPNAGTGPMISYNTARYQLYMEGHSPYDDGVTTYPNNAEERLPDSFVPRVDRMGDLSQKVWIADGARYSDVYTPPDYDLSVRPRWGGSFADISSYSTMTRSWDRSRAPGNGYLGSREPRRYAFRHADNDPPVGAPGDAFKLNLAFHDGHVETQGDLTSSNPHQWLPTGSRLGPSTIFPDTRQFFGIFDTIDIN